MWIDADAVVINDEVRIEGDFFNNGQKSAAF